MSTVLLFAASPALAAGRGPIVLAPPGNSAVSQYVEVVPTAQGGGIPRPPGGGSELTAAQTRAYDGLGQVGRLLVGVVAETAPAPARTVADRTAGAASAPPRKANIGLSDVVKPPPSGPGSRSPLSLVLSAVAGNGQGGAGFLLPGLLLVLAFAVGAIVVLRRQAHRS